MELVLVLISVASLAVNVIFYKMMRDFTRQPPTIHIVREVEYVEVPAANPLPEPVKSPTAEDPNKDKYSAWVNRTGITNTIPARPAPPIPVPQRAPLERPHGFV